RADGGEPGTDAFGSRGVRAGFARAVEIAEGQARKVLVADVGREGGFPEGVRRQAPEAARLAFAPPLLAAVAAAPPLERGGAAAQGQAPGLLRVADLENPGERVAAGEVGVADAGDGRGEVAA